MQVELQDRTFGTGRGPVLREGRLCIRSSSLITVGVADRHPGVLKDVHPFAEWEDDVVDLYALVIEVPLNGLPLLDADLAWVHPEQRDRPVLNPRPDVVDLAAGRHVRGSLGAVFGV